MFRIVSLSVVLTLIVILGITFFKVVAPFLLPLFLAGVTAILAQPLFLYLVRRTGGRVRLASGLATGTLVLAILAPLSIGTVIASFHMFYFAKYTAHSAQWDRLLGSVQSGTGGRTDSAAQWIADRLNDFTGVGDERSWTDDSSTTGEAPPVEAPNSKPGQASASSPLDQTRAATTPAALDPTGAEPFAGVSLIESGADAAATADDGVHTRPEPPLTDVDPAADEVARAIREGKRFTAEQVNSLIRSKFQQFLLDLGDRSLGIFTGLLYSIVSSIVGLLIFLVALYYFFADGTALLEATQKLIPVHVEYQREMLNEFARAVRGVVSATFLAALGQAVATTAALWLIGFDHLLTLFVLGMLAAMIPALGTWLVWGPCAVMLLINDPARPVAATMLILYGSIVVGLLDNIIRTYVLNSDIKLHPLLALISVLGGLQMMGLWGVFIGPIVASCLYALVRIFNHELTALSRSRFGDHAVAAANTLISSADAKEIDAECVEASAGVGPLSPPVEPTRPATSVAPSSQPAVTTSTSPAKSRKSGKGRR